MLGKFKIFAILTFFCMQPLVVVADSVSNEDIQSFYDMLKELEWDQSKDENRKAIFERLDKVRTELDTNTDDLEKNYEDLKANEQSLANRTLTAATTAATGIGGMELARGLSEQKADKDSANDMAAYIATMRCTYGEDKQVKAGPNEIELPGSNGTDLAKLRSEYLALAADLKERKTALGMKPGIESEEILDKASSGLYDDESLGIDSGAYASLYRAQMLGSEADQEKIDADAKASKNRVLGGAIAAGAGAVIGIAGNSLINGKLGDLIKEKNAGKSLKAASKIESDALKNIQKCLKDAGIKDTDKLSFSNFYPSVLSVKNIKCKTEITTINGTDAKTISAATTAIFEDSKDAEKVYEKLVSSFGPSVAGKMIGITLSSPSPTEDEKTAAINTLNKSFEKVEQRFIDAANEDDRRQTSNGNKTNFDFASIASSLTSGNSEGSSQIMGLVNSGLGNVGTTTVTE